ncbi:MAG: M48 family peptidase, partial [Pseudomonadota bacterium]
MTVQPGLLVRSAARMLAGLLLVLVLSAGAPQSAKAQLGLIRDAEIEGLLRLYAVPVLRAAGLNP